jgi:hypothetical protein
MELKVAEISSDNVRNNRAPELQQPAKSKPEPVLEFLTSKEEEEAAGATKAATSLSANLNWADPASANDDWDSIVATANAGKKKKKDKKRKVRYIGYVIDTSLKR